MCGIAGFLTAAPCPDATQVLARMTAEIRHRGPDGEGFYDDGFARLGHRRLSIIDLATGGQPMCNEDGTVWITYNGEIFNHAALRPALESVGHRYKTHCDTETILHSYEQHGPACVGDLRGMFAFALWDTRRKTLFCARDRLGIKPFYYFWDGSLFAFASEIKALLQHPLISARFNEALLPEYLTFGYGAGEDTLFTGIRKLMPGHYLLLAEGRLEIVPFWDVPAAPVSQPPLDERDYIAECRARLEETVRMRLMSDVPLGMFLSGGVDSSAIAALMKRMVDGPVITFAVGYREDAFSELPYARHVAGLIGTDHQEIVIGMRDFFDALPRLIWHEDEPIAWPSSVSLYFVARLAAQRVKVVLTGEGADELFAGYARYRHFVVNQRLGRAYSVVPPPLRRAIRAAVAGAPLLSGSVRRKLQHTVVGRPSGFNSIFLDNFYAAFTADEQRHLLESPGDPYAAYLRHFNAALDRSALARLLYADQKTYLVELLMKQDQMSMACSIESRVPFLDHPFVEFASRVPDSLKLRGSAGKYILKKAVADLLPPEIIYRRKMGFPTPLRQWLAGPGAANVPALLRDPEGLVAAYIDPARLESLLDRHRRGLEDATDRIWRLLNLQIWGRLFLTGQRDIRWDGWESLAGANS
jgi:asparagine synthase (glutamine-hydrolysing)